MSDEVKAVTDVIKDLGGLKEHAREVRDKLQDNIKAASEMLTKVDKGIADPLGDAVKELGTFLAETTNQ